MRKKISIDYWSFSIDWWPTDANTENSVGWWDQYRVRLHHLADKYVHKKNPLVYPWSHPNQVSSSENSIRPQHSKNNRMDSEHGTEAREADWILHENLYKGPGSCSEDRKRFFKSKVSEQCVFTFDYYVTGDRIHCGLGSFTSYDNLMRFDSRRTGNDSKVEEGSIIDCDFIRVSSEREKVSVCHLDMSVQVQSLKESYVLLSIVKFREEKGYLYQWYPGHSAYLVKNGWNKLCVTFFFPLTIWCFQSCEDEHKNHIDALWKRNHFVVVLPFWYDWDPWIRIKQRRQCCNTCRQRRNSWMSVGPSSEQDWTDGSSAAVRRKTYEVDRSTARIRWVMKVWRLARSPRVSNCISSWTYFALTESWTASWMSRTDGSWRRPRYFFQCISNVFSFENRKVDCDDGGGVDVSFWRERWGEQFPQDWHFCSSGRRRRLDDDATHHEFAQIGDLSGHRVRRDERKASPECGEVTVGKRVHSRRDRFKVFPKVSETEKIRKSCAGTARRVIELPMVPRNRRFTTKVNRRDQSRAARVKTVLVTREILRYTFSERVRVWPLSIRITWSVQIGPVWGVVLEVWWSGFTVYSFWCLVFGM